MQFGAAVTPITHPRLPNTPPATPPEPTKPAAVSVAGGPTEDAAESFTPAEQAELDRLHGLGIPVPGLEIHFGAQTARVWLEKLEVECQSAPLRDRVRAVVGRAVETVAPVSGA
jgi:cleavage and polyadenylation specificity factor subunit 3